MACRPGGSWSRPSKVPRGGAQPGSFNPRDEAGWRIPKPGTEARKIYDMRRAGHSIRRIAMDLNKSLVCVRVTLYYMRHATNSRTKKA